MKSSTVQSFARERKENSDANNASKTISDHSQHYKSHDSKNEDKNGLNNSHESHFDGPLIAESASGGATVLVVIASIAVGLIMFSKRSRNARRISALWI